eukprot:6203846-Pleurochrysis_carterae.AAC.3
MKQTDVETTREKVLGMWRFNVEMQTLQLLLPLHRVDADVERGECASLSEHVAVVTQLSARGDALCASCEALLEDVLRAMSSAPASLRRLAHAVQSGCDGAAAGNNGGSDFAVHGAGHGLNSTLGSEYELISMRSPSRNPTPASPQTQQTPIPVHQQQAELLRQASQHRLLTELLFSRYLLAALRTPESYSLALLPGVLSASMRSNLSAVAFGLEQLVHGATDNSKRYFTPQMVSLGPATAASCAAMLVADADTPPPLGTRRFEVDAVVIEDGCLRRLLSLVRRHLSEELPLPPPLCELCGVDLARTAPSPGAGRSGKDDLGIGPCGPVDNFVKHLGGGETPRVWAFLLHEPALDSVGPARPPAALRAAAAAAATEAAAARAGGDLWLAASTAMPLSWPLRSPDALLPWSQLKLDAALSERDWTLSAVFSRLCSALGEVACTQSPQRRSRAGYVAGGTSGAHELLERLCAWGEEGELEARLRDQRAQLLVAIGEVGRLRQQVEHVSKVALRQVTDAMAK